MKAMIASAILALTLIAGAANAANASDCERSWVQEFFASQDY